VDGGGGRRGGHAEGSGGGDRRGAVGEKRAGWRLVACRKSREGKRVKGAGVCRDVTGGDLYGRARRQVGELDDAVSYGRKQPKKKRREALAEV
jgi:hypothetical protein